MNFGTANSLPPGQQKTSNARGMPGGECLSFDYYYYNSQFLNILLCFCTVLMLIS